MNIISPFLTILLDAQMSIIHTAPLRYYAQKEEKLVILTAYVAMVAEHRVVLSWFLKITCLDCPEFISA